MNKCLLLGFQPFTKYADFSGRARRWEYWLFHLIEVVVLYVSIFFDKLIGLYGVVGEVGPLSALFCLAVLVPHLAVAVRRLHDTDRSGWWLLIIFVPVIGVIWLFFIYCLKGTSGANRFGRDPR